MKITERKNLILSIVSLFLAFLLMTTAVFAWFVNNNQGQTGSLDFTSADSRIVFSNEIKIIRTFQDSVKEIVYKRDGENYFEYDKANETWVLNDQGNKESIRLTGLFPNEYIDFVLTLETSAILEESTYNLQLDGVLGEIFTADEKDENGEIVAMHTHSILEAIKIVNLQVVSENEYVPENASERFLLTYGNSDNVANGFYTALDSNQYAIETDSSIIGSVQEPFSYVNYGSHAITQVVWAHGQQNMTIAFRLVFDTYQISQLNLATNEISLMRFNFEGIKFIQAL